MLMFGRASSQLLTITVSVYHAIGVLFDERFKYSRRFNLTLAIAAVFCQLLLAFFDSLGNLTCGVDVCYC